VVVEVDLEVQELQLQVEQAVAEMVCLQVMEHQELLIQVVEVEA
tara:strand:- start:90 stop:221 length:132 start_codon:yes stop_codon:yes gene_type:complete